MDILTLAKKHRKGVIFMDGTTKADREYIDFVVSGQSLGQLLGVSKFDLIGTFGWSVNKEYENNLLDEFLGNTLPELETGRSCFYVCPECGDIGCGAISAKIEVTDDKVIWMTFAYENNYSEPDLKVYDDYMDIGPFTFDKSQYISTLRMDIGKSILLWLCVCFAPARRSY